MSYRTEKYVKDSLMVSTRIVMPDDTNFFSHLMGGNLMKWMDVICAISAMKHSNAKCVTVAVDNLTFKKSVHLGSVIKMEAYVTRVFSSSLETYVRAYEETFSPVYSSVLTNEAYFTFVAVNDAGTSLKGIAAIIPESEEEKRQYDMALKRRKVRLYLSGKLVLTQEEMLDLFSSGIREIDTSS